MKIKILKYVLVLVTIGVAFMAWLSVDRAINVPEASNWAVPIILFSVLFIFSYLSIIIIKRAWVLQGMFLAIFLLSFLFVFNFGNLVALILAYLFSLWGLVKIRKDLQLNVKLSLWKSIHMGSSFLLLAFAIMITSQYYFEIKDLNSVRIIPQFNVGDAGGWTSKFLLAINPDFKSLDQDGMTIDQFILQAQKNQEQANGDSVVGINDQVDEMVLQEGRQKFSEVAGMKLTGSEKVSDVLANVVNQKINQYLGSGLTGPAKSSPLPYIMAIALFLAVLPLGSFLNTFWILLVEFIFFILVKTKLVNIVKIPVEMEVIE